MTYNVVEKFVSINGEGPCAGELAAFIRFRGCGLCCTYCDTRWANSDDAPAEQMTENELTDWVISTGVSNVTLTGGEPLMQDSPEVLIDKLISAGCHVEIETNGSIPLSGLASREKRPVFTMDYKLPGSGMEKFMVTDNFKLLNKNDTVKFVAGSIEDLDRAAMIIREYKLVGRCNIYLSPVFGKIAPADMVDYMKIHRMNGVRLQLQLHKFIWDPQKRGV